MAHMKSVDGVQFITGAIRKKLDQGSNRITVTRVKHVKDPLTGEIVACGPNEIYYQESRDLKRNPLSDREKAQRAKWSEACIAAKDIINNKAHPRYMELYLRWREQLNSPSPRKTFPNFVRAVLVQEMKSPNS